MRSNPGSFALLGVTVVAALGTSEPAHSASHQWRFNEVFSNADGTVQFIEMLECCGFDSETALSSKWILAVHANNKYTFRSNLTGNTANKYLLLATQGFADIPGAPAPDFLIPSGFLPVGGDTLEYWLYDLARWICPALPLDGISSMGEDGSAGVNTPTNYDGETGTIDLRVPVQRITWGTIKSRRP
jgi:serralysin